MIGALRGERRTARTSQQADLTVVLVCRDDEDVVGRVVGDLATELRSRGCRFEIQAVDEGSCDNTLALLALLRRSTPELSVIVGVPAGRGLQRGFELARGEVVLLGDVRADLPAAAVGAALDRVRLGFDAVAVEGQFLTLRRARAAGLVDSLTHRRDGVELARRFVRRARSLGLAVSVASEPGRKSPLERLGQMLGAPLPLLSSLLP